MRTSPYDVSVRQTWIDALRGWAIIFVVLFHLHLVFERELASFAFSRGFATFIQAVGPFRMEILYFLSGMLAVRSMRKGWKRYVSGKIDAILWPYMVWTVVMLLADNPRLAQNLVPALYGFSHLSWFLAFLFLYYLIAYATRNKGWWLVAGVSYGLSILLFVTGSPLDRGFVNLWDVPYYFLYFVAGCRFVQSPEAVALFHQDRVILAGWLAGIAVIAVAVVISPPNTFPGYLPVVLASLPFWFWMASARPLQAPLAYVGRNAIYFFVLHYPIIILGKRFLRPPVWLPFRVLCCCQSCWRWEFRR